MRAVWAVLLPLLASAVTSVPAERGNALTGASRAKQRALVYKQGQQIVHLTEALARKQERGEEEGKDEEFKTLIRLRGNAKAKDREIGRLTRVVETMGQGQRKGEGEDPAVTENALRGILAPRGPSSLHGDTLGDLGEEMGKACQDWNRKCPKWKKYCDKNKRWKSYMRVNCPKTCTVCTTGQDCKNTKTSSQPNDDDDLGATARCKITLPGTPAGKLQCKTEQSMCYTANGWRHKEYSKKYFRGRTYREDMYTIHVANRRYHECVPKTGGAVACPDGIGPLGVLMTANLSPRHSKNKAVPKQGLPLNVCAPWSYIGTFMLRCHPLSKACTKAQVLHPHGSKRSVGTLILKRTVCDGGACKVFKVGRCVDVGKDVWRSIWNQMIGHHMSQEAKKFAAAAEICLAKEAGKSGGCGACSLEDGARSKEEVMSA